MTNFQEIIDEHRDEIIEKMREAEKGACENPALSFAVAVSPDGAVYSWSYVGNYSEPEAVWNGTDLCVYSVSDSTSSWRSSCMDNGRSRRDNYSCYLNDGEHIPEDLDDNEIADWLAKNLPHVLEDWESDAIDWAVSEAAEYYDDTLDNVKSGLIRR